MNAESGYILGDDAVPMDHPQSTTGSRETLRSSTHSPSASFPSGSGRNSLTKIPVEVVGMQDVGLLWTLLAALLRALLETLLELEYICCSLFAAVATTVVLPPPLDEEFLERTSMESSCVIVLPHALTRVARIV